MFNHFFLWQIFNYFLICQFYQSFWLYVCAFLILNYSFFFFFPNVNYFLLFVLKHGMVFDFLFYNLRTRLLRRCWYYFRFDKIGLPLASLDRSCPFLDDFNIDYLRVLTPNLFDYLCLLLFLIHNIIYCIYYYNLASLLLLCLFQ